MWLRSHIAVAVVQASGYSPDSTPSLGTSIRHKCGPKKTKKKKKKKKKKATMKIWDFVSKNKHMWKIAKYTF